jgi:hypothetical protein
MGGFGSGYTCSDEVFNMVGLGTDGGQARSDLRPFVERQLYLSCASGSMINCVATCLHMYSRHEFTQFSKAFPSARGGLNCIRNGATAILVGRHIEGWTTR